MSDNKKSRVSMAYSVYFHDDLMIEIMSRLPAKSLVRLKSVSRKWKSIVEDPNFIAMHHKLAYSRPDSGSLVISIDMPQQEGYELQLFSASYQGGPACPLLQNHPELKDYKASPSTHGLILLSPKSFFLTIGKPVFVFNPATRELVKLPSLKKHVHKLQKTRKENFFWVHYFLGFDPLTGVYKVLSLYSSSNQNLYNVLTLGTKQWRKLDTPNLPLVKPSPNYYSCVNGAIYFKANPFDETDDYIAAFNVGEENFRMVSHPRDPPMYRLMELGGQLGLLQMGNVVWILEDENQDKWIRVKLHNLDGDTQFYNVIGGVHSSNKLLLELQYQMLDKVLWVYYCDKSGKDWSEFKITGLPDVKLFPHQFVAMNNIETLFSARLVLDRDGGGQV